jgi:DNA-binding CsgD family transcriptional regulator
VVSNDRLLLNFSRFVVSVTLSPSDVARLPSVFATLVSPLDYERVHDWREASRMQIESLLGADHSAGVLPCAGERYLESSPEGASMFGGNGASHEALEIETWLRHREIPLDVFQWADLCDDSRAPFDGCGMAFEVGAVRSIAGLFFFHDRGSRERFGERGLQLLRLLLPAFKAGVDICVRLAAHRTELARLFDGIDGPLMVFDCEGQLLQQNPAMTALLQRERKPGRFEVEIRSIARAMRALVRGDRATGRRVEECAPLSSDLQTATANYRISGSILGSDLLAPKPLIAVAVGRSARAQLTHDELQVRYGLTRRETETARLLAARRGNSEIAHVLGMSAHTARHHTEKILLKLGVSSRREVERALLGIEPGLSCSRVGHDAGQATISQRHSATVDVGVRCVSANQIEPARPRQSGGRRHDAVRD